MNAIDDLLNGTSSDDAFHRHCEAHFKPSPQPMGCELEDIEAAQLVFDTLPQDRAELIDRFGLDVISATPTIFAQRSNPN